MGIASELDAKISEVEENIARWFDDLKARAAPVIVKAGQYEEDVESDPFIGAYLAANFAVPEHLVSLGLDFLGKLVSASAAAPAVTGDQQPAGQPAAA